MQNKILKITRMGLALVILALGALPALAQDCTEWVDDYNFSDSENWKYWKKITLEDIQTCLNNGKDVNARAKNGLTPIHLTARYNDNPEVITALIKAGANINARDINGSTTLDWAAGNKKY